MRGIPVFFLASLVLGGSAVAAERAPVHCEPLAKIEAQISASVPGVKFTKPMTVGQFHVAQGIYLGMPGTPAALPPGDGAILGVGPSKGGALIWTREGGKIGCGVLAMSANVIAILEAIHTGKLEEPPLAPSDKPVPGELTL